MSSPPLFKRLLLAILPDRLEVSVWELALGNQGPPPRLLRTATQSLTVASLDQDPAAWLAAAESAIADLLRPLSKMPVRLYFAAQPGLVKTLRAPVVEEARQESVLAFESARQLPFPLEEALWSAALLHNDGVEWEVLLAAVRSAAPSRLVQTINRSGWQVEWLGIPPMAEMAAAQFLSNPTSDSAGSEFLQLHIGRGGSHLIIHQGEKWQLRTLPIGFPTEDTEEGNDWLKRLGTELQRTLAAFRRQQPAFSPNTLFLSGWPAQTVEAGHTLGERLGIAVTVLDLSSHLSLTGAAVESLASSQPAVLSQHAAAAAWGMGAGWPQLNLLPMATREKQAVAKRRWEWAAATIAAVLAVAWLATGLNRRTARQSDLLDSAQPHLQAWEIAASQGRDLADEIALERLAIDRLLAWQAARQFWQGLLADFQNRLSNVEDVWLDEAAPLPPPVAPAPPALEAGQAVAVPAPPPARLAWQVSGRMVDRENPLARVSTNLQRRVNTLLVSLAQSPYVAAIDDKRFDTSENGLLRFSFTVVLRPPFPGQP